MNNKIVKTGNRHGKKQGLAAWLREWELTSNRKKKRGQGKNKEDAITEKQVNAVMEIFSE